MITEQNALLRTRVPAKGLRSATCWPTASSRRSAGAPGRDRTCDTRF